MISKDLNYTRSFLYLYTTNTKDIMKKLLLLLVIVVLTACSGAKKDFSKVLVGMSKEEVQHIVGKPVTIQDLGFSTWLIYDHYIVAMVADTVNEVVNKEGFAKDFEEGLEEFDKNMNNFIDTLNE